MKDCFNKIKESGFTLIEVMVAMGLLAFVMGISMNVLSIVLELTNDADYSAVLTQESNYVSERVKRLVRSADSVSINNDGDSLTLKLGESTYTLSVTSHPEGGYMLTEGNNSVMSSEVYIEQFGSEPIFSEIDSGVGVRMTFNIFHVYDDNQTAGAVVYTQAIRRNKILNQ